MALNPLTMAKMYKVSDKLARAFVFIMPGIMQMVFSENSSSCHNFVALILSKQVVI